MPSVNTEITSVTTGPVANINAIKGGPHIVATTAERDAIFAPRRLQGMEVTVLSPLSKYQLGADLQTWTQTSDEGISLSAFTGVYVSPSGNDGNSGSANAPFLTIAAAYTYAASLNPTTIAPAMIHIAAGTYTTGAINIAASNIHLRGDGMDVTIITPSGGNAVTVSSANVSISNLTIRRATGGNSAYVFNMPVTEKTNFLSNVVLRNVKAWNQDGVAVGTMCSSNIGCHFEGTVAAVEMAYGSNSYACTFLNPVHTTGSSTAGMAAAYVIKWAQSVGDNPSGWGEEYWTEDQQHCTFKACRIYGQGLNTRVIGGLKESSLSGYQAWQEDVFQVSAAPPKYEGCEIKGPYTAATSGAFSTYGTNAATVYGCCIIIGGSISGAQTFMHCLAGYVIGCYIVNISQVASDFAKYWRDFSLNSCSIPLSPQALITDLEGVTTGAFNCQIENDLPAIVKHQQPKFRACFDVTGGIMGFTRTDLAIKVYDQTGYCHAESVPTAAYSIGTFTVEFRFKIKDATKTNIGIASHSNGSNTGWFVFLQPSSGKVRVSIGGTEIANVSASVFDGAWHHIAFGRDGVTGGEVWIDGVSVAVTACAAPTGANRLVIGAVAHNVGAGTANDLPGAGMLADFRISSISRYATTVTFTPPSGHNPDSSTLSIYGRSTTKPLVWEDKMFLHDLSFGATPPVWVRNDYTNLDY